MLVKGKLVKGMCCWSSTRPLPSSSVSCATLPVTSKLTTLEWCYRGADAEATIASTKSSSITAASDTVTISAAGQAMASTETGFTTMLQSA